MARDPLCSSPEPTMNTLVIGSTRSGRVQGLGAPPCITHNGYTRVSAHPAVIFIFPHSQQKHHNRPHKINLEHYGMHDR